jgi:Ran GTPase-activating protein (RanGAP) involved in mRNA processing and transport
LAHAKKQTANLREKMVNVLKKHAPSTSIDDKLDDSALLSALDNQVEAAKQDAQEMQDALAAEGKGADLLLSKQLQAAEEQNNELSRYVADLTAALNEQRRNLNTATAESVQAMELPLQVPTEDTGAAANKEGTAPDVLGTIDEVTPPTSPTAADGEDLKTSPFSVDEKEIDRESESDKIDIKTLLADAAAAWEGWKNANTSRNALVSLLEENVILQEDKPASLLVSLGIVSGDGDSASASASAVLDEETVLLHDLRQQCIDTQAEIAGLQKEMAEMESHLIGGVLPLIGTDVNAVVAAADDDDEAVLLSSLPTQAKELQSAHANALDSQHQAHAREVAQLQEQLQNAQDEMTRLNGLLLAVPPVVEAAPPAVEAPLPEKVLSLAPTVVQPLLIPVPLALSDDSGQLNLQAEDVAVRSAAPGAEAEENEESSVLFLRSKNAAAADEKEDEERQLWEQCDWWARDLQQRAHRPLTAPGVPLTTLGAWRQSLEACLRTEASLKSTAVDAPLLQKKTLQEERERMEGEVEGLMDEWRERMQDMLEREGYAAAAEEETEMDAGLTPRREGGAEKTSTPPQSPTSEDPSLHSEQPVLEGADDTEETSANANAEGDDADKDADAAEDAEDEDVALTEAQLEAERNAKEEEALQAEAEQAQVAMGSLFANAKDHVSFLLQKVAMEEEDNLLRDELHAALLEWKQVCGEELEVDTTVLRGWSEVGQVDHDFLVGQAAAFEAAAAGLGGTGEEGAPLTPHPPLTAGVRTKLSAIARLTPARNDANADEEALWEAECLRIRQSSSSSVLVQRQGMSQASMTQLVEAVEGAQVPLTHLSLRHCTFSPSQAATLNLLSTALMTGLAHLTSLTLSHLTAAPLHLLAPGIAAAPHLRELHLQHCSISTTTTHGNDTTDKEGKEEGKEEKEEIEIDMSAMEALSPTKESPQWLERLLTLGVKARTVPLEVISLAHMPLSVECMPCLWSAVEGVTSLELRSCALTPAHWHFLSVSQNQVDQDKDKEADAEAEADENKDDNEVMQKHPATLQTALRHLSLAENGALTAASLQPWLLRTLPALHSLNLDHTNLAGMEGLALLEALWMKMEKKQKQKQNTDTDTDTDTDASLLHLSVVGCQLGAALRGDDGAAMAASIARVGAAMQAVITRSGGGGGAVLQSWEAWGNVAMGAGCLEVWSPLLGGLSTLKSLSLRGCGLSASTLQALGGVLPTWKGLSSLDLGGNMLPASAVTHLTEALLQVPALDTLRLGGCSLGKAGFVALLPLLQQHPALSSLSLELNRLGDDAIRLLSTTPPTPHASSLTHLSLAWNALSAHAMHPLCAWIMMQTQTQTQTEGEGGGTLISLDLEGNPLGPDGVVALFPLALRQLQCLQLGSIECGSAGATALAAALAASAEVQSSTSSPPTLRTLSLSSNALGDTGMMALIPFLKHNTSLTSLNLCSNGIGPLGLCALAEMVQLNVNLQMVKVTRNNGGTVGENALRSAAIRALHVRLEW